MSFDRSGEDAPSDSLLTTARSQFRRMNAEMNDLLEKLQAGDPKTVAGFEGVRRELLRALNTAVAEEQKLEERCKAERGAADGYAIDFDAARAEIGRRLARLRAAGNGGDVS